MDRVDPPAGRLSLVAIARLLSAPGGQMSGEPITVTSDPGLQFRVVDAFGDLAEALALSGPVLIGVDDLQWADPSSLVALATIGRRLADLPVGIIGCLRPVPRNQELDGALRALQTAGARQPCHLCADPCLGEDSSRPVIIRPRPARSARQGNSERRQSMHSLHFTAEISSDASRA